jgi:hypothetical protein
MKDNYICQARIVSCKIRPQGHCGGTGASYVELVLYFIWAILYDGLYMKKFSFVLAALVLGALPAVPQSRFAASINPLPGVGFFFDGYGIGGSCEAALFPNVAIKAYFSVLNLDMVKLSASKSLSAQDLAFYSFGLKGRYYISGSFLSGFFGGLHLRYVRSTMEVTFKPGVRPPFLPPSETAEFREFLLGPELGYKFVFPFRGSFGLYLEPSAGYNIAVKSGGDYSSYKSHVPSEYQNMTDWIAGKGFYAAFSLGLVF